MGTVNKNTLVFFFLKKIYVCIIYKFHQSFVVHS